MIKQRPYIIPDGYFQNLEKNLCRISSQNSPEVEFVSPWTKLKPYLALATVFAVALIAGSILFKGNLSQRDLEYEQLYYLDLILASDPYQIYDDYSVVDNLSEEDILDYLIESNTSLTTIEYLLTLNQ